jgi:4'-phosphopantetheinyl transferase
VNSWAAGRSHASALTRRDRHIHLWFIDLSTSTDTVRRFERLLAPDESRRADGFRFEHLRSSFIVARGVLRSILSWYLGTSPSEVQFTYGEHGKPALAGAAGLCFNLAHSGDRALLAVTYDCEVGVDLEQIRSVDSIEEVAQCFFSPVEAAQLASLPPSERQRAFFLFWTSTEACIKASGLGMLANLDRCLADSGPGSGAQARSIRQGGDPEAGDEWTVHCLSLAPEYAAALAYQNREQAALIKERPLTVFGLLHAVDLLPTERNSPHLPLFDPV